MSNQEEEENTDLFTFVPNRNKDIPTKRFARWKTNVRPIKFFKTWDTTFSGVSETADFQPDSPKFFSQPAPKSSAQEESQNNQQNESFTDPDNPKEFLSPSSKTVSKPSMSKAAKETEEPINQSSDTDYRNADQQGETVDEYQPEPLHEKYDPQEKQNKVHLTELMFEESDQQEEQNADESVDPTHGESVTKVLQRKDKALKSKQSSENRSEGYTSRQTESDFEMQPGGNQSKRNVQDKSNIKLKTNETLSSRSRYDKAKEKSLREAANEKSTNNIHESPEKVTENDNQTFNNVNDGNDQIEAEEIDITHRIPLAQSTAIGIEIEQDFDDDEEDDNEGDDTKQEEPAKENRRFFKHSGSLKRKLTLSTPKKTPSSVKKRKISITGPVKVQNIVHPSLLVGETEDSLQQKNSNDGNSHSKMKSKSLKEQSQNSSKKTKDPRRSSVTFNPTLIDKQAGISFKARNTPDLRREMLLSYANTPSGVTPGFIAATPVSGPVIRPTQKRRPQKVPIPVEISSDTETEPIEELRLWQGDFESKRKNTDVTDIDVILQHFEEMAWEFKESIESVPVKKAVTLFSKKTQKDLRNLCQSIIKKKRVDLLSIQKDYVSLKAGLSTLRIEHDTTCQKSQRFSDVLKFKRAIEESQEELQDSLRKSKSKKVQIIGPKVEHHKNLSDECIDQLKKIQSKTLTFLQLKRKR